MLLLFHEFHEHLPGVLAILYSGPDIKRCPGFYLSIDSPVEGTKTDGIDCAGRIRCRRAFFHLFLTTEHTHG